jgi:pimeloyl-ACP methyl ester carboxylesterase
MLCAACLRRTLHLCRPALVLLTALMTMSASSNLAAQNAPAPTWTDPSPHHVRYIPVAHNVRLEVLDWGGTGAPLVFLTGLGDAAHVFDDFALRFRDGFHVYAITRRGFGASSRPDSGYDAATRARDIVTVLDSLHIRRATLVGHSIAGDELSKLGATYPSRVRALVYLDAYDYGPKRIAALGEVPMPASMVFPPPMTRADSASPSAVTAFYSRLVGGKYPEAEVRTEVIFDSDGHLAGDAPSAQVVPQVRAGTEPSAFARITAPALGVFAVMDSPPAWFRDAYAGLDSAARLQADRYLAHLMAWNKEGRDRFRADLVHGTVIELHGADHYVFLTNPDQVERAMRDFITQLR